jgi:hypothetical protein
MWIWLLDLQRARLLLIRSKAQELSVLMRLSHPWNKRTPPPHRPIDAGLIEAVQTIIYAAPRCDVKELNQVGPLLLTCSRLPSTMLSVHPSTATDPPPTTSHR